MELDTIICGDNAAVPLPVIVPRARLIDAAVVSRPGVGKGHKQVNAVRL